MLITVSVCGYVYNLCGSSVFHIFILLQRQQQVLENRLHTNTHKHAHTRTHTLRFLLPSAVKAGY